MDDLISRQAAIDTLATGEELLRRVLDDMDVVSNEREKYEWGLGLIESYIADMKDLPSAQPEIIRCKDCKFYEIYELKADHTDDKRYKPSVCVKGMFAVKRSENWFCADAERRSR